MVKALNVLKWGVSLGKGSQNFLGARWIQAFLKRVADSQKRRWALRILSLSPHYFFDADNLDYRAMGFDEYLEANFEAMTRSREFIYEKILLNFLEPDFEIMD